MAIANKNQQLIFDGQCLLSKSFNRRDLFSSTFKNCCLDSARFKSAILSGSVFINCSMKNAKLNKAHLNRATFIECDLSNADFRGAFVHDINFIDCYMTDVLGLDDLPMRCPETGGFTAWKKGFACDYGHTLIQLYIPDYAKRSSAGGTKCRCNTAKVLSITHVDDESIMLESCQSLYNPDFIYTVGEYVTVENFDERRWNECSTGIHFFVNKKEALEYP